jgi:hypothetical protein
MVHYNSNGKRLTTKDTNPTKKRKTKRAAVLLAPKPELGNEGRGRKEKWKAHCQCGAREA